jgi:hypothetical protein
MCKYLTVELINTYIYAGYSLFYFSKSTRDSTLLEITAMSEVVERRNTRVEIVVLTVLRLPA